jgi:hypothetical protein
VVRVHVELADGACEGAVGGNVLDEPAGARGLRGGGGGQIEILVLGRVRLAQVFPEAEREHDAPEEGVEGDGAEKL